jgi:pimeloyl-ACP methyl ester carboxylesterase
MLSHDIEIRGARLRVHEYGEPDGPVVVLQHGWPQTSRCWRKIAPSLAAEGRRVLCPDLRGFGASSAPGDGYEKEELTSDLFALLDELGVGKFTVAGHDWGGFIAFLAALRDPERVERVCAMAITHPWGGGDPTSILDAWRGWYAVAMSLPLVSVPAIRAAASLAGSRPLPRGWTEEDASVYFGQLREPERAHATQQLYRSFVVGEAAPVAAGRYGDRGLQVPGLYVRPENDAVVTERIASGWEAAGPNLRYEVLEGRGHFVLEEDPAGVVELLRGFLAPVPRVSRARA